MRRLALLLPLAACGGPSDTDTSATSEASTSAATSSAGTTGATTPDPTTGAPTSGGTSEAGSTSAAASTGLTATDGTGDATSTTATATTATTDATTDVSSTGGSSGDASTGSTGEPPACQPGDMQACYDGPPDTEGKGLCKAGVALCDQGVFGPCAGAVLPAPESCDTPGDEDCDGLDPCAGDGPYQWHKVWGAGGDERGVRVGFDGTGALVLAAQGSSVSDFGGGPLLDIVVLQQPRQKDARGDRGHARHEHDARVGAQQRRESLGDGDLRDDVDLELATQLVDRQMQQRSGDGDAGIVEGQVNLAEPLQRRPRQGLDIVGARHVAQQPDGLGARLADLDHDRIERIGLDVGQHQLHAQPRADPCELPSEAAARPGDDRHLAGEVLHARGIHERSSCGERPESADITGSAVPSRRGAIVIDPRGANTRRKVSAKGRTSASRSSPSAARRWWSAASR
jgi:hypothetical protein